MKKPKRLNFEEEEKKMEQERLEFEKKREAEVIYKNVQAFLHFINCNEIVEAISSYSI